MMGPHHLNEVFFDDCLGHRRRRPRAPSDEGWRVVQDVLSFERVGIARYARCERLLHWAPAVLGDHWDALPAGATRPLGPDADPLSGGPGCSPTGSWTLRAGAG